MSQKMDRRREIAAQRAARSARFQKSPAKMRAEAQEYAAAQRAEAAKLSTQPAAKKANVLERTTATVFDVAVANPTDGLMEWIEGASIDLPLGIVGVVGGWINDDFGNTVRNVVAHDTWGALMGDRMQEWSAASYTNGNKAGEIVEEVANGLGGMLPTVIAGIATGGASAGVQTGVTMLTTAAGAAGKATQGAYQDGASREAGLGYGFVSGGIEAGTEKLLGGAGTLGNGWVKTGGKVAAQGGKRVLKSMAEEAGEEILAELADPIAKTIYKGGDALADYGTSEYWLGVAEAGLVGGLTAGAHAGTIGHAVNKMRGANADIAASLESIEELGDQQDYLFVKHKLDAKKYSTINANVKSNYNNIEKVLKKVSPETRARLMETYKDKLHDAFDDNGNMRSEFATELDRQIAVGQMPTDGVQTPGSEFSPYVSPNLAANREELESDLALINEDLGRPAQNGVDKEPALQYNKKRQPYNFKFLHKNFPSENEAQSEAHRLAIWWVNRPHVETRDQALISMNNRWYLIEKFADAVNGYQVESFVPKKEYDRIYKEIKKNGYFGSIKSVLETSTEYDKLNKSSNPTERRKSSADSLESEYRRESDQILRMDKREAEWGEQSQGDRGRDSSGGSTYQQGDYLKYSRGDGKSAGADQRRVSIFDGELSEKAQKEYTNLKRATNNLNSVAGDNFNIAIVNADADFNGVTVKGKNIYISAELLESGYWAPTLIHELTHFTEGSPEYNKFARFLLSSNPEAAARKASELTAEGNAYGFTRENVERDFGGTPQVQYSKEKTSQNVGISENSENVNTELKNNSDSVRDGDFASELIASIAEDSVGTDGAFIDRLVRGNETLAAKVINKIQDAVAALESRKSPEARAEYKRLKNAEKLFMRAVESTGKRYVDGKIVADDEEPEKIQFSRMNDAMFEEAAVEATKNYQATQMLETEAVSVSKDGNIKLQMKQAKKSSMSNSAFTEEEMLKIRADVVKHFNLKGINGFEQVQRGVLNTLKANGFFESNGERKVVIRENGMEVTINRGSIEETFGSGSKYESIPATFKILKLATIEQIPNIIENASVVVEKEKNKYNNGKNKAFTHLNGTATIEGKSVSVRVTLKISKEKNKFWVHYVDVIKNTDDIFGLVAKNASPTDTKLSSAEDSVPQKEKIVKKQIKKSSVQSVKKYANENNEKVYTKKEMRAMLKNVSHDLLSFDDGDFGLVGQNQTKVVEKFFNAFNAAKDDGRRYAVCMELADYMLKHASMLNAELPPYTLELTERLNVLRRYIHKLDLDGIRGEIKHRYGKDNSPYLLWHKSGGMSPDAIVSELAEQGIIIEAENEADIFFEIEDLYKKYRQTLNEDMNVYLDDTLRFVTAEERHQKQEEIAKELLVSFDRYGSASKLARFTNEYERRINDLKDYIHEIKDEAAIKNKAIYVANQIKQLKNGDFVKASDYRDDRFDGSIGKLANITYRGNLKRGEVIRETLGTLRGWYADHSNKLFHGDEGGYRDDISNMMYEISQGEGELSYAELQGLVKVLDYFKKMIETQDKIYKNGKWIEARPVAKDFDKRMRESRQIKSGFLHKLITGGYQQQFGDNASVMRAADLYDPDGFFTTTFTEFRKAAEAAELMKLELRAEMEEFFHDKKNKKYIKRLTEEKVSLRGEEITVGEAISLYMTHNREQAWSALCKSGFVVKDKKGKTHTFRGLVDEKTAKKLVDNEQMKGYINKSKAEIRELLNDTDMEYISIIERAFAKCSSIKEKIDVERLGYSNVLKNKYYYPIRRFDISKKVDDTDYYFEVESASHMSFNENTVKSSNRLSIEATDTVFNRHVNGIALYANFAIINENLNRVLNISTKDTAFEKSSLAMTIKEDKKAQEAWNFLQKIKDDISGLKVNDDKLFSDVMGFLRSGYAKAALAANPKVLATQLSSFVAAGSMLEYNSIIRGISMRVDKAEVDKYCKTALLRNAENTVVKAQTITDKAGKVSDTLMAPIGMVDRSVVVKLFGACQVQVEKDKGLKLGTEENKKAAGELLSEVIFETQQNSLITERSAAMRSQQEVMKSLVMFSADAMKLTGRFIDSVGEWHAVRARIKYLESDNGKAENAATIKTLEARKAELKAEIEKLKGELENEVLQTNAIKAGMTDAERYEILKNRKMSVSDAVYSNTDIADIKSIEELGIKAKGKAEKIIKPMAERIGIIGKKLNTADVDFDFIFSKNKGLMKSLHSQLDYGGTYSDFAKAIINLEKVLESAVLIEQHDDKYKGTDRENKNLEKVYVLLGAFKDGVNLIPVQLEIKKFARENGRLYMTVAMTKIEADVMVSAVEKDRARLLVSASEYSIADILKKVKPLDKNFLKYVPDNFLSDSQRMAKQEAIREEERKIEGFTKTKEATLSFTTEPTAKEGEGIRDKSHLNKSSSPILANPRKSVEQTVSRTTTSTNSISDSEANVNSIGENISVLESELRDVEARLEKNKNAKKELDERLADSKKKLARSVSALVSSSVFMSAIALAFRYLYGRLDDKEPEEIALDVGVDLFGNMIGGLPFARDVYSLLLEGYEIDISSVSMLSDVLSSTKSCAALLIDAISGKEITAQKAHYTAKKVVTDVCHLFGVPVRNMYNATYGTIKLFHPSAAYTMDSWFYDKNYRSDLKEALENDDYKMISTITGLMLKDGNTDYDAGAEKAITELVKQGYSVLPRSVGDTVTYNGETVSLTATQRRTIQKTYRVADVEINKLSRISAFKGVSSDIQAKAINFIYEMYWQRALAAAFGSTGKTKNELFAAGIDPYVLAIIVATARSMESDKDAKGKAISGSRLKKIEAYLESQRLSAAQKHMLLGYLGYRNAKGEDKVKAYISSLTLTASEKAALMEYSGYTAA